MTWNILDNDRHCPSQRRVKTQTTQCHADNYSALFGCRPGLCADRLHRPHLVSCYLLTACDCSAISPCTTTVRPHEPSSRHVRRIHDILAAGLLCVQPTVQLSSHVRHQSVRVSRRHETSPSPRPIDIRPTDRPADNELGNTAVERDPYRLRIELAVKPCDRRSHQLSAYSTQQIDAKGIVDFVRHRALFCDYFFFGTLYYKCAIRLSACDVFLNADVCAAVLNGNSLNGER